MPVFRVGDVDFRYMLADYTDPWRFAPSILAGHGLTAACASLRQFERRPT